MKKNKINIIVLAISCIFLLNLTGCSSAINQIGKVGAGLTAGNYKVTVWSGGSAVAVYEIKNSFVNSEKESDGWFFFVNGKLVRVSGTITIEQQ